MSDFVPHTESEVAAMLAFMGLSSVDELFAAVPGALRLAGGLDIESGLSEPDVLSRFGEMAAANRATGSDLVCFAGAGAYDHDIPAVVRRLAFRSEFVTAYTPYQAEVAQGVLQALFEYQTLVCRLSGLDVANASLYDGASACVEAINLAVAATGNAVVWVSQGVHPHWREVIRTFAAGTGHDIREVPLGPDGGTAWPSEGEAGCVLIQHPNYLGCIEDLVAASAVARRAGALLTVAADPVAAGILRPPATYGADVVVGEGQPFGTPLSFGGPFLGTFACRLEHVRRLPGRLVGETVDVDGRRAYVTTLRTREQDIRREKASSNVCTNQTLIAVAYAVHLAWVGTAGLRELALRCARGTRYARESVLAIDGVETMTSAPVVREFAVRLPVPTADVVDRMAEQGFLAGVPLGEEYGANGLLVAVTEKRTRDEVDAFAAALEKAVG
ncbi:MAG TPA: aminomethyl-transferring glycine dehydrogenase subunit GcvPA [Acidimicrobiales bacterium]|nr:aminomethyl-transferring glycine dehydrogenase subunit GcvPA [Acidimicrobiales bacterium]